MRESVFCLDRHLTSFAGDSDDSKFIPSWRPHALPPAPLPRFSRFSPIYKCYVPSAACKLGLVVNMGPWVMHSA